MNRMRMLAAAAALALTCGLAANASANTLWDQPTDLNGAFSSQNDTNSFGNFATVYDDFNLAGNSTITGIAWTGSYYNPPSQGAITSFTVSIYSDNAGQPGAVAWTQNFLGAANEAFLGLDNFGDPTYTYSVATSVAVNGGTTYWLSVVPNLGFPPQWGWETAGQGVSYQDFFGSRSQLATNEAFTLTGVAGAPEPMTWALMLVGFGGLGGALRSRRRVQAATA